MPEDALTSLLVRFHDARTRFDEPTFEFDTFKRQASIRGEGNALRQLETLCCEALSYLPSHYLEDVHLLDPKYSDTELWCLGVAQVDWVLGRGLIGSPFVRIEFADPGRDPASIVGLGLRSPFEFQEDIRETIPARFATRGTVVSQIRATNHVRAFADSCNATSLLKYRRLLPASVDQLIPSYENAVRLLSDIGDLISVAERLGRCSDVISFRDDPSVAGSCCGGGILVRLGVNRQKPHRSLDDLRAFIPITNGWSVHTRQLIRNIPRVLADYFTCLGLEYPDCSTKEPFDYRDYPIVPHQILEDLRAIVDVLRAQLRALKCDDVLPVIDVSVRDTLAILDTDRKVRMSRHGRIDRFDVFLAHNSKNKKAVKRLLKRLGALRVWYDDSCMIPGVPGPPQMDLGIRHSDSAAVLVGDDGLGPWESEEVYACISQAVKRGMRVIPVLLPGKYQPPELPSFLETRTWVDLRSGIRRAGIAKLIAGIKGEPPGL